MNIELIANLSSILSLIVITVYQLAKIEKHLSDNIKDLKLELTNFIRDRTHLMKEESNKLFYLLDERIDNLEKDIVLLKEKVINNDIKK